MNVTIAYFIFSLLTGFIPGCYAVMLSESFPTALRYSGVATSYNAAYAIFGGLSPLLCTLIIPYYGPMAPAFYFIFTSFLAGFVCWYGRKSKIFSLPTQTKYAVQSNSISQN
jgi:hypothetical protein